MKLVFKTLETEYQRKLFICCYDIDMHSWDGVYMNSVIGVLAGLSILVLVTTLRKPVWLALLTSALFMGFIGAGFYGLFSITVTTISSSTTIDLIIITALIAIFVNIYRETGFLSRLGDELVKFLKKPKAVLILVPAVMGLLPIAGGALMSAPIVDSVGNHLGIDKKTKLFINVWFRHVIFQVYPLSSVLITVATLTGVDMWGLVIRQAPIALTMLISGYITGFHNINQQLIDNKGVPDFGILSKVFSPIILAITLAITLSPLLDMKLLPFIPLTRYSMIISLISAIILILFLAKSPRRVFLKATISKTTLELVLASFSAVLLKDTFISIRGSELFSGIVLNNNMALKTSMFLLIPFALSFTTGSPLTGAIVSLSIFQLSNTSLRETSLIYASNMLGYIASPAHLCYVYTAEYFKTTIMSSYREMFISVFFTITVVLAQYLLIP